MKVILKSHAFWIGLLLLLSIPAMLPLFHKGFFVSDDGEWMIIRLSAFYQSLRDGQFPVRFLGRLNHEYGYPVSNFLYPGFLYMGSIIHLFGFGVVDSVKILFGLSLFLSALGAYLWLGSIFPRLPAFLGSVVYLYLPYHVFDTFKRGSLGEVLAIAIVPFFFWSIERGQSIGSSITYGLLLIAHNSLSLLFSPMFFIYTMLRKKTLVLSFFFGLGLASFFWIPALYERPLVIFDTVSIASWREYFLTDFRMIGFMSIALFLIALVFLKKNKKERVLLIFFILAAIIAFYFTQPISRIFWEYFPLGKLVQFPWRFLSLTLPSVAFGCAYFFGNINKKYIPFAVLFLFLILSIDVKTYLNSLTFMDKSNQYYETNDDTTTVKNEYMPIWVHQIATNRQKEKILLLWDGNLTIHSIKTNSLIFDVNSEKDNIVNVNTIYYPGWSLWVNEKLARIDYDNVSGLIRFPVRSGISRVRLSFGETPIRKLANSISLLTILILSSNFIIHRKFGQSK